MTRFRPILSGSLVASALLVCPAGAQGRPQPAPGQPYFEFMVDKPVSEAQNTVRPRYPVELKAAGVQGQVLAQFVVDTTGLVEPETFKVLRSSHDLFTAAVSAALPGMRFVSAEVRGAKVRQLVQQPFIFAIAGGRPLAALEAPARPMPSSSTTSTAPPPQETVAGWVFEQRTTIDSANGRDPLVMTTRYAGAAGKVRSETSLSTYPTAGGPMVTIMDSADHSLTMVLAVARMASVSTMPAMPSVPRSTFAARAPAPRVDRLGPGEAILGLPTMRTHAVHAGSITQSLGSMTCTRENEFDSMIWMAADPTVSRIQRQMARSLGSVFGQESDIFRMLDTIPERADASSILRTVSTQRATGPGGRAIAVTTTTEVVEARLADLNASIFAVPMGYRVDDLRGNAMPVPSEAQMLATQERIFWRQFDSTATLANGAKACVRAP